jgi:hypothetical protein
MRRIGTASILAMAFSALLSGAPANKAKVHGYSLSGTVSSVDQSRKTFVVKNSAGRNTTLYWTSATTIVGGELKAGGKVTLRYLDKDGKHIATSVVVAEVSAQKTPAPTPSSASPSPTANR